MAADSKKTQCDRVLASLIEARGGYVPAPELARVGGLQFQTRIYELKHRLGFVIENKMQREGRKVLSWYRLIASPTGPTPPAAPTAPAPTPTPASGESETLFDMTTGGRHRDDG